jgi:peptidoglycan/LPS O-acetylase OafA/YrhL
MTASLFARFALRRSLRLDPPYWAAIAICIGFSLLASAVVHGHPTETYSFGQVVAHLFYLQEILGFRHINLVFWTLCLEIQFYLAYAALLLSGRPGLALIGAGAVSLLWPLGLVSEPPPGFFPPLWHGFLLGAGAYWAFADRRAVIWFLLFSATVAVSVLYSGNLFTLVCVSTALVLFAFGVTGRLQSGLSWRPLQYLGLISYSLYLFHDPVTGAVFRIGYMLTGRYALTEAIWWVISLAACIVFAGIMWWAVERPSMKWARKVRLTAASLRKQASVLEPALPVEPTTAGSAS